MNLLTKTIILTIAVMSCDAIAQESPYKYELDKPYTYMSESNSTTKQQAMGQTVNVKSESNAAFSMTITERTADGNMKGTFDIQSAVLFREDPQGLKTFGDDLANTSFTFTMEPNGRIIDIDSSINDLEEESQGILQQIVGFLPNLPHDKLEDGESWTRESADTSGTEDQPIYIENQSEYEVDGTEEVNGIESLKIVYEREQAVEGEVTQRDQDYTMLGENVLNGSIYYAKELGIITKISVKINGERVITMPSNPSFQVTITTTSDSKVEYITE